MLVKHVQLDFNVLLQLSANVDNQTIAPQVRCMPQRVQLDTILYKQQHQQVLSALFVLKDLFVLAHNQLVQLDQPLSVIVLEAQQSYLALQAITVIKVLVQRLYSAKMATIALLVHLTNYLVHQVIIVMV